MCCSSKTESGAGRLWPEQASWKTLSRLRERGNQGTDRCPHCPGLSGGAGLLLRKAHACRRLCPHPGEGLSEVAKGAQGARREGFQTQTSWWKGSRLPGTTREYVWACRGKKGNQGAGWQQGEQGCLPRPCLSLDSSRTLS